MPFLRRHRMGSFFRFSDSNSCGASSQIPLKDLTAIPRLLDVKKWGEDETKRKEEVNVRGVR